ncbi:MAG: UDP-3-O-(3-hydroxymyristoyl)glucosamine N-acyltransferase [Leptospiraceae bacterium]
MNSTAFSIKPFNSDDILKTLKSSGIVEESVGDSVQIQNIGPIDDCGPGDLAFADKEKFLIKARERKPACLVLNASLKDKLDGKEPFTVILVKNVGLAHSWIRKALGDVDFASTEDWGRIHSSAVIHDSVQVPESVVIGPGAIIGPRVKFGERCVVMAGVVVERDAVLGDDCVLHPGVVLGWGCILGHRCIIRSGTIIGSEGFGFAQDESRSHHRIPQTGIVRLGNDVVLGSNNCIDRATYGETLIHDNVISDNLCHLAHNVDIGEKSILVAMTGIAGSTKLGKRVICSGQTGILDHITIPDDTVLVGRAAVLSDNVKKSGVYAGSPLQPIADYQKNSVHIKNLDKMRKEMKSLQKRLEALEGSQSGQST